MVVETLNDRRNDQWDRRAIYVAPGAKEGVRPKRRVDHAMRKRWGTVLPNIEAMRDSVAGARTFPPHTWAYMCAEEGLRAMYRELKAERFHA